MAEPLLFMRFFSISKLKTDISSGGLPQKEVLHYSMATWICVCLSVIPSGPNLTAATLLFWIIYLALNVFGLSSAYRANGGADGIRFLDKLFAVGWVVGIRGIVLVLIPLFLISILALVVLTSLPGSSDAGLELLSESISMVIVLIYLAWAWLRIAFHLRQLREFG